MPGDYKLNDGEVLFLKSQKYKIEKTLEYFKFIHGKAILKFLNVNSIGSAYKILGYEVHLVTPITKKNLEPDLIDFQVKDLSGSLWGKVKHIKMGDYNQLLDVEASNGDIIYVPFHQSIIKEIDDRMKIIIIDPPEGLKELNK